MPEEEKTEVVEETEEAPQTYDRKHFILATVGDMDTLNPEDVHVFYGPRETVEEEIHSALIEECRNTMAWDKENLNHTCRSESKGCVLCNGHGQVRYFNLTKETDLDILRDWMTYMADSLTESDEPLIAPIYAVLDAILYKYFPQLKALKKKVNQNKKKAKKEVNDEQGDERQASESA